MHESITCVSKENNNNNNNNVNGDKDNKTIKMENEKGAEESRQEEQHFCTKQVTQEHDNRNVQHAKREVDKLSSASSHQQFSSSQPNAVTSAIPTPLNDYYFDSYSHYGIHMEMLKDYHRTSSYRDAIWSNRYLFKDKVVLDVGCGTGILSLFAARAGARKVIGIDCSSVALQAKQIVHDNRYDNIITIVHGKVEELQLTEKVDIIISEWMGYFLLYESMLNTVLYARDRWGKPNVQLFPSHANMYICGITDPQYKSEKFDVWNNVQGINYSYFKRLAYIEPLVDTVCQQQIVTNMVNFFAFDLSTVTEKELNFNSSFQLQAHEDYGVDALSVHFDTPFKCGIEYVVLDTSPYKVPTHWRQTVLYLYHPLQMRKNDIAKFTLSCGPNNDNPRDLDIHLTVDFDNAIQECHYEQDFRLR